MIYLDNAATTYPKSEAVYATMDYTNRNLAVNSGRGTYKVAEQASRIIAETKQMLLDLFSANGIADVVFTPSVTHAINQVLRGLNITSDTVIYLSPYEHNAVARTVVALQKEHDCRIAFIPIKEDLSIDLAQMEYNFSILPPDIVVINAISNVTGYMLPLEQICDAAKVYNAITIIDAAQAAGLIPLNLQTLAANIICFAGHKTLGGPFGIGGFVIRKSLALALRPVFTGGTGSDSLNTGMPVSSPAKFEAASPNIIAVSGLRAALLENDPAEHFLVLKSLTDYLIQSLSTIPKVRILGYLEDNIGIISFVVDGYESGDVGKILDEEYDIAVRTGYHCAPFIHCHLNDADYAGTVRIGLGRYTTKEDINTLASALRTL